MRTAPMLPTSARPANRHDLPASGLLKTPFPIETFDRRPSEPVPAYTMRGSDSLTRMSPIDPTGSCPSLIGTHDWPASVVFQMPPPVLPM